MPNAFRSATWLLAGALALGCAEDSDRLAPETAEPAPVEGLDPVVEPGPEIPPVTPTLHEVVLPHPCPVRMAGFGSSVALADLDGEGTLEVAVGANSQGVVHLFRFKGNAFKLFASYQATGPVSCPVSTVAGDFGSALAAGNLDGDPVDEVVVGAPATAGSGIVHVIGLAEDIVSLPPAPGDGGSYGKSVLVGDFDGDGVGDLAVGAPGAVVAGLRTGKVVVHLGPVGEGGATIVLEDPAPVDNGNFGHFLAGGDWSGDGIADLVVSAVGNTVDGAPLAGQVYVYPGPIDPTRFVSLVDPVPVAGDFPRFGMHIAQRGGNVAVGSPRKDWNGVKDAGLGVLFHGRAAESALFPHPMPFPSGLLGFRVALVDYVGDARPDLAIASLPKTVTPSSPGAAGATPVANRGLWIWDGAEPGQPTLLRADPTSEDHFPQGIATGQLFPGGYEEIVLGDPTWDRPGEGKKDDVGRVVVYFRWK